jgi:NADPH-dependent 7-cyano-7-deazaguanine reductase QueF-like protein
MTPLEIQKQLAELTAENSRGFEALYQAEVALAQAEHDLDLVEQKAFIKHQGTVADRNAVARLEAAEARLQRDLRKAEANRIRMKIKAIESALMASATQAKLIQAELRS